MKHTKKLLALALVIMSLCTFVISASAIEDRWVDASGWLNFRATTSTGGTLIDKIANGLPVTWYYSTGSWSRISFDGTLGYVVTSYLTTVDPGYDTPQNMRQAFGYYLLQRGSVGYRVKNLQLVLSAEGFFTGSVNGNFAADTEDAVKKYQKAENIEADGLVGEVTKSHLWGDYSTHLMALGSVE